MKMLEAVPALPVSDMDTSIAFYRDTLGFTLVHEEEGFAVLGWDEVQVHLWHAYDEKWRRVGKPSPVVTGAESFLAGTASCRIGLDGVDDLYAKLVSHEIIHPNAPSRINRGEVVNSESLIQTTT